MRLVSIQKILESTLGNRRVWYIRMDGETDMVRKEKFDEVRVRLVPLVIDTCQLGPAPSSIMNPYRNHLCRNLARKLLTLAAAHL